jgi:hypothetical protein
VRRGAASCRAVRGSWQWRRRSGPQHRCRHRGAVLSGRAPPGAVGRPPSRSSGRPTSSVRCSGVRTDRPALSAALPPRGPRRAGPGVAGWGGPPAGRSRSRCPGVRGRWSPASGLTGSDGAAVGRARLPRGRPSPRADAWPASRLRRRLAAGPTRAGPGPGCRPGGGARDAAGAHRSPRRASGRSPAWCPTMGLDQEVVATLRGRCAGGGPVASGSGRPTRFSQEQTAAAARPRDVGSAAREVLTAR